MILHLLTQQSWEFDYTYVYETLLLASGGKNNVYRRKVFLGVEIHCQEARHAAR